MPVDLTELLDPLHTAVVTSECQSGVLGPQTQLPALADVARERAIPNMGRLAHGARVAGVQVVHCVFWRRADGRGGNTNGRLFAAMAKQGALTMEPGSEPAMPIPELHLSPDDLVLGRYHGLDPIGGTDLDPVLRNLGVRTVVVVGVSVNVALLGLCIGLVNTGYQVVLPRDAVAGIPVDYAEALIDNTYRMIANVVMTDDILAVWS